MVKLQKHKAYTYKSESGKEIQHYKHTIVVPEGIVHALGWDTGIELIPNVEGDALVLKPEKTRLEIR